MNWHRITRLLWVGVLGIVLTAYPFNMAWGNRSVRIPSGSYKPLYRNEGEPFQVEVTSFLLDKFPTTNQQFLNFIQQHAQWKRSARQDLFADSRYLAHWSSDLDPYGIRHHLNSPVTNVSWFAATAYCRAQGKRLPQYMNGNTQHLQVSSIQMAQRSLALKNMCWSGMPGQLLELCLLLEGA